MLRPADSRRARSRLPRRRRRNGGFLWAFKVALRWVHSECSTMIAPHCARYPRASGNWSTMDKQAALVDALKILWTSRMHAASDEWHIEDRAVPMLVALADETEEPLVRRAIQRATKAHEWLDEAKTSMGDAIRFLEQWSGADQTENGENIGGEVAGYSVVRSDLNGRDLAVDGQ